MAALNANAKPQILRTNRKFYLICAIMVGSSAGLLGWMLLGAGRAGFLGNFLLFFSALSTLHCLSRLCHVVIISEEGVEYRSYRNVFVPWSEIRATSVSADHGGSVEGDQAQMMLRILFKRQSEPKNESRSPSWFTRRIGLTLPKLAVGEIEAKRIFDKHIAAVQNANI